MYEFNPNEPTINKSVTIEENLIPDALEYYDANLEIYGDFFKNVTYVKFETAVKDMDHNIIHFYDAGKKEFYKSRYEIIGVYTNISKTWIWAWSISRFRKNTTYIAKKIVNYGMDLDPESKFLKTELINSRFRISNPIQLDIHAAIAAYLSKKPVLYRYKSYMSFTVVDGLVNITQIPKENIDDYNIFFMFLLDYADLLKDLTHNK